MRVTLCPSRQHLLQSLHYHEPSRTLYLNNAKSGCSTIKASLIRAIAKSSGDATSDQMTSKMIHGRNPIWSNAYHRIRPDETFSFSIVRNPYTRILSAYLDKICRKNLIRRQFYNKHNIHYQQQITFETFLSLLKSSPGIPDQHWRPQTDNLLVGLVRIRQVHYLESLSDTAKELLDEIPLDIEFETRSTHSTNAPAKLEEHLTERACQLVQELHARDFEVFGYSTDPAQALESPGGTISLDANRGRNSRLLSILGLSFPDALPSLKKRNFDFDALTFYERALLCWHNQSRELFDTDRFRETVFKQFLVGDTRARYVAAQLLTSAFSHRYPPEVRERAFLDQIDICPYFPGARSGLISFYIDAGRPMEAQRHLRQLRGATWHPDLVRSLEEKIAALPQ